MTTEQALPPSASPEAVAPPRRGSRWTRLAGAAVTVFALIRLGLWGIEYMHPSMPQCDASGVQTSINGIYKERAKLDVKTVENVQTLARSDDRASCSAHLTLSNDEKNTIVYALSRDGRSIQVKIEKATDG